MIISSVDWNVSAVMDFVLYVNSESTAVHIYTPESFSHRLWCSHCIPFCFSPALENANGLPWESWRHYTAFKSLKSLYKLPRRQAAATILRTTVTRSQSSMHRGCLLLLLVPRISIQGRRFLKTRVLSYYQSQLQKYGFWGGGTPSMAKPTEACPRLGPWS